MFLRYEKLVVQFLAYIAQMASVEGSQTYLNEMRPVEENS